MHFQLYGSTLCIFMNIGILWTTVLARHHRDPIFPEERAVPDNNEPSQPVKPPARPIRSRFMTDITINCTDGIDFEDGTTCANGSVPPNLGKLVGTTAYIEKTALWYSPENAPNVELVKKLQEECSPACQSGQCYYSMKHFDFLCGQPDSDEILEAQEDLYKVELTHFNYGAFPKDMICWTGDQNGFMYNPKKTNLADLKMAEWYERKVDDHDIMNEETTLSVQCQSRKCQLNYKVHRLNIGLLVILLESSFLV